jgi:DHA1 family purine ribonucleoside efflux pump-like MFS transporter
MATAMAAQLTHPDHVGRALTVINAGVSLATIAAVPLGAWLGDVWGWRGVFLLGSGLAVLALVVQALVLPSVAPTPARGLQAIGSVLRSRIVRLGLFAVLLMFAGHFGGFTYIRPAAQSLSHIDDSGFAVLLLVFGIAGLLGTAVSGPMADRVPRLGILMFPSLVGLGMITMIATGSWIVGLFIAAVLWGFGFGGLPTTVLSWGARTEPDRLEQIGGLIVTVCNLGIALGAVVGGVLVDSVSISMPLLVGAIASIMGAGVLFATRTTQDGGASN